MRPNGTAESPRETSKGVSRHPGLSFAENWLREPASVIAGNPWLGVAGWRQYRIQPRLWLGRRHNVPKTVLPHPRPATIGENAGGEDDGRDHREWGRNHAAEVGVADAELNCGHNG